MILSLFYSEIVEPPSSMAAVYVAIIGVAGIFITAYFANKGNKEVAEGKAEINRLTVLQAATETSLKMAKQEIGLDSKALSFWAYMQPYGDIMIKLKKLCDTTKTTRFLLLRAWNGCESPRYTTAVIQFRQGEAEYVDYIHFALDEDYVDKLLKTRRRKVWKIDVSKEGDTAIGDVYRSETPPVTHADWHFVHDEQVDEKRVIITYCSFGTTDAAPFTAHEEIKHRLLVNAIQEKFDKTNLHSTR